MELIGILLRIDWGAGVVRGETGRGYVLWEEPLPPALLDGYRAVRRADLRAQIGRRCAGIRRRQGRRRG